MCKFSDLGLGKEKQLHKMAQDERSRWVWMSRAGVFFLQGRKEGVPTPWIVQSTHNPTRALLMLLGKQLQETSLWRPRPARITIHHDESHPSHIDLSITRGNIIGAFYSGRRIRFGRRSFPRPFHRRQSVSPAVPTREAVALKTPA